MLVQLSGRRQRVPFPTVLNLPFLEPALMNGRFDAQRPPRTLLFACPGLDVDHEFEIRLGNFVFEVEPSVEVRGIDAGVDGVEQELLAVHGASAMIGSVGGGTHPFEVADLVASDSRMNVGGLWRKRRTNFPTGDGLR